MSSVDINPQNQFPPQNKADFGRGRADSRVAGVRRRVANPRGHATDRNPARGQSPGSFHAGRGAIGSREKRTGEPVVNNLSPVHVTGLYY